MCDGAASLTPKWAGQANETLQYKTAWIISYKIIQ